jgi:hypothetical protein
LARLADSSALGMPTQSPLRKDQSAVEVVDQTGELGRALNAVLYDRDNRTTTAAVASRERPSTALMDTTVWRWSRVIETLRSSGISRPPCSREPGNQPNAALREARRGSTRRGLAGAGLAPFVDAVTRRWRSPAEMPRRHPGGCAWLDFPHVHDLSDVCRYPTCAGFIRTIVEPSVITGRSALSGTGARGAEVTSALSDSFDGVGPDGCRPPGRADQVTAMVWALLGLHCNVNGAAEDTGVVPRWYKLTSAGTTWRRPESAEVGPIYSFVRPWRAAMRWI